MSSRFTLVLVPLISAPDMQPTIIEMTPVDTGSSEFANGSVTAGADGVPASYRAVADDDWNHVAQRLTLDPSYLWQINCLRRSSVVLYVGDTINLDPRRAATVGDENGVVLDVPSGGACLSGLPPQD